jgi:hypothetical protein
MKKIVVFILILFILMVSFLTGCDDDRGTGMIGHDSDFFGTWKTSSGSGSFTLGNSIRFNNDYTCDFFWSGSTHTTASGTWVRHNMYNNTQSAIVITIGEKETVYYYGFFDNYHTL